MNTLSSITRALLALATAAALHAPATAAPTMIGHWYGEGLRQSKTQNTQWITEFKQDGTFKVAFRSSRDCQTFDTQAESGVWERDGNLVTMITTTIAGQHLPPQNLYRDVYDLKTLTTTKRIYTHRQTGIEFSTRRVSDNFEFPPCKIDPKLQQPTAANLFNPQRVTDLKLASSADVERLPAALSDWAKAHGLTIQENELLTLGNHKGAVTIITAGPHSVIVVSADYDTHQLTAQLHTTDKEELWHPTWTALVEHLTAISESKPQPAATAPKQD